MTVISYLTSFLSCRFWFEAWKNQPHLAETNRQYVTLVCPAPQRATFTAHGILSENYQVEVRSNSLHADMQ